MILHPLPTEFPNIGGKFFVLFYQCTPSVILRGFPVMKIYSLVPIFPASENWKRLWEYFQTLGKLDVDPFPASYTGKESAGKIIIGLEKLENYMSWRNSSLWD
jgi:hypothetical protein